MAQKMNRADASLVGFEAVVYLERLKPVLKMLSQQRDRLLTALDRADEAHNPENEEGDRNDPTNDWNPYDEAGSDRYENQAKALAQVVGSLLVLWIVCDESDDPSDDGNIGNDAAYFWIHV